MRITNSLGLTARIIGLIILGLLVTAGLLSWRAEDVLEEAMLAQAKRQALIYLLGIERDIQDLGVSAQPQQIQTLLEQAMGRDRGQLGFSIRRMYAYDPHGNVFAFVGGSQRPSVDGDGHFVELFRTGRPILGEEVETYRNPDSGLLEHKADIVVPIHNGSQVTAGLEVELDLEETMRLIQQLDNAYERQIMLIVVMALAVVLLFISLVVRRGLIGPLRKLGELTERIAHGEFSSRVSGLRADEFGHLGDSINRMADSIEQLFTEQERAYLQAIQSLAKALEAKDAYTAKHSSRVAKYSVMLGRRLGLDEEQLKLLKQGALIHDLGKIGISDAILNKPTALDEHEFEVMREHPVFTASIMRPLKRFEGFTQIAAWHHERWDGNGYPDGLAGEEIPLLARIVAIADSWDAMTGDRIYRKGMSNDTAIAVMERERDSGQWDPHLLGMFVEMIRGEQQARHEVEEDMFSPEDAASG